MKCYEYFDCKQMDCIARFDDRHCWQLDTTDCVKRLAENSDNKSIDKKYEEYDDKSLCERCAYHEEMFHPKKKKDIKLRPPLSEKRPHNKCTNNHAKPDK